jgi:hypothetical protein
VGGGRVESRDRRGGAVGRKNEGKRKQKIKFIERLSSREEEVVHKNR